jgi:integrase
MTPDSIMQWLAKFSEAHHLPHIHPHAFRHTAASTMIASGIDLVTTAHELGHANATTTATIYAHSIAVAQAKAAQARSGVFDLIKPKEAHPEQVD